MPVLTYSPNVYRPNKDPTNGVWLPMVVRNKPHIAQQCEVVLYYPPGKDTLMSVGLFLESGGIEDQLSPRNDVEDESLGSALDIGTAAVGVAVVT